MNAEAITTCYECEKQFHPDPSIRTHFSSSQLCDDCQKKDDILWKEVEEDANNDAAEKARQVKGFSLLWPPYYTDDLDQLYHLTNLFEIIREWGKGKPVGAKCSFTIRLQDGREEVHIVFHHEKWQEREIGIPDGAIIFRVHTEDSQHRFELQWEVPNEMGYHWTTVSSEAQQRALDKAKAIIGKAVSMGDVSYYGMLADTGRCDMCNRKLKDPVSKILRLGPDCARRSGLKHSSDLAKKVKQWREAHQPGSKG